MAWTYSGDPSTSKRDETRFLMGDTDPDYAYLTDAEVDFLLSDHYDYPRRAAVAGVKRILAKVASQVDYKIGPEQVKASQRLKNFQSILDNLLMTMDGVAISPTLTDGPPPIFEKGMHDNPGWTQLLRREW